MNENSPHVADINTSTLFAMACFMNKHAMRGKGAIPRWLAKFFPVDAFIRVKTSRGAFLFFPSNSWDMAAHFVNHAGEWNEPVIKACIAALSPGSVFYDIGANVGVVTVEVSKSFDGNLECVAFEPQHLPSQAIGLASVANGFSRIRAVESAVGDRVGEIKLYSSSHAIHVSAVPREKTGRPRAVACASLDSVVYQRGLPPPTALKVDVEGGEFLVFKGAERLIREHSPTIIFESDDNMERWGYFRRDVLQWLSDRAPYTFHLIRHGGLQCYDEAAHASTPGDIVATTAPQFSERFNRISMAAK